MAAAVAGGYFLGRTKKAKLALGLAMFAAGKRLKLSPGDLAAAGMRQLTENPQLAGLRDQVREDLYGAVKTAAAAAVDRQVSSLTGSLRDRTEAMANLHEQGGSQEDEEPEDGEPEEGADVDEDEDEAEYEDEPASARPKPKKRPAKKAAAKKTAAAKRAPGRHPAKAGR